MNIKGFRRMLFGEKMPDKNDPKYKDRYEREVSAGRKFAQATRIDKAAAKVQGFANAHRILFLVIVFGFAIGGFTWNIYRITMAYRNSRPTRTATEMQDSVLRERHKRLQGGEIRENRNENKKYESQYTVDDIALLDEQQQEKAAAAQIADAKTREQEALAELEKALAEARLRGRNEVLPATDTDSTASAQPPTATIEVKGKIEEESRSVKAPSENEPPSEVVRKVKTASDYFNTLAVNAREPKLIKAIIDEDIKAVDGSRVRLRLLDDVEINECVVKRGSYLYATMSGFSSGRVKGNITSILIEDELVKVSLSLYDTDGMEGLYVPNSQFRETSKDVASGAVSGNLNMNTGSYGNSLSQWGMQAATNAYQKTSNAIGKAIKKNKVKLKYGTFVYLVNGREKQ